jgi:endonuclease G
MAAVLIVILLTSLHQYRPSNSSGPVATQTESGSPVPLETSAHLVMGNPSGATDDPANPDNYLMRKGYFALSYNNARGTPNWVSWCLQKSDLGSAPRGEFYPDPTLPRGFKRIFPKDYRDGGFDRGHMCPHGDRAGSPEASRATFVMTNIIPQAPNCDQLAWADLEVYGRSLAKRGYTLYIVSGPQGKGGEGSHGRKETIDGGAVIVPARCWKVMLVLRGGTGTADDVGRVSRDTRLIAVVMPNDQSVEHGWEKYRTSVKEVENLTGYRFFDRVPADIIGPLKEKVDRENVPHGGHRK